jgi:hypothetical protein
MRAVPKELIFSLFGRDPKVDSGAKPSIDTILGFSFFLAQDPI